MLPTKIASLFANGVRIRSWILHQVFAQQRSARQLSIVYSTKIKIPMIVKLVITASMLMTKETAKNAHMMTNVHYVIIIVVLHALITCLLIVPPIDVFLVKSLRLKIAMSVLLKSAKKFVNIVVQISR
jgi:hypothetical protein